MKAWLLPLLLVVGLTGCVKRPDDTPTPEPTHTAAAEPVEMPVVSAKAATRVITSEVEALGTVAPDRTANLGSDVSGRVEEVTVDLGDPVSEGQVLIRLSTRDAQLQADVSRAQLQESMAKAGLGPNGKLLRPQDVPSVKKAKSAMDDARQAYEDYVALSKEDLIARRNLQERRASYQQAQADYATALEQVAQARAAIGTSRATLAQDESKISEAVVRAPFAGYVQQKGLNRGDYLSAGTDSGLIIMAREPLYIMLDIPQQQAPQVGKGRRLSFTCDAAPKRRLDAVVERIAPGLDPTSRALSVKARVHGAPNWLRPGMAVRAELATARSRRDVLVPASALLTQKGASQVFVLEKDGTVRGVPVKAGERVGSWVAVTGVKAGQQVAASDLLTLKTGVKVKSTHELPPPRLEAP